MATCRGSTTGSAPRARPPRVADECCRDYSSTPSDGSPWTGGSFRIYRGGGFRQDADGQAVWIRYCGSPSFEQVDVGIRCCR